jgi:hypothetical protein
MTPADYMIVIVVALLFIGLVIFLTYRMGLLDRIVDAQFMKLDDGREVWNLGFPAGWRVLPDGGVVKARVRRRLKIVFGSMFTGILIAIQIMPERGTWMLGMIVASWLATLSANIVMARGLPVYVGRMTWTSRVAQARQWRAGLPTWGVVIQLVLSALMTAGAALVWFGIYNAAQFRDDPAMIAVMSFGSAIFVLATITWSLELVRRLRGRRY